MGAHEVYRRARHGTLPKRAFAFLAVALMVAVVLVPMVSAPGESDAGQSETHTVVYHMSGPGGTLLGPDGSVSGPSVTSGYNDVSASGSTQTVVYEGSFVSTEYNPQVWDYARWLEPTIDLGYSVNGEGKTVVFTGWSYAKGFDDSGKPMEYTTPRYPGEVMSDAEIEAASLYDEADKKNKVHVYATWGTMVNYVTGFYMVGTNADDHTWKSDGNEYTNIMAFNSGHGDANLSNLTVDGGGLTVRGAAGSHVLFWNDQEVSLNQNLIVDHMKVKGSHTANHGDAGGGIFANGNVLILGNGIVADTLGTLSVTEDFTQIFGGSKGGSIMKASTDQNGNVMERRPYGADTETMFGTFVIVHSGTFGNIVAGSLNGNIGTSYKLSTYLVLRDVRVLDTVVGGSGEDSGTSRTFLNGSTFLYAYGLKAYGDSYEEDQLGNKVLADTGYSQSSEDYYAVTTSEVFLNESTIITGGSNNGWIGGDTHVYLGGDSEVWDVQGAGRRGMSTVAGTAHLEVSGDTLVKHVACGSITDGNHNQRDKSCVKHTVVTVKDSAKVAMVLGAGYDSYAAVTYASMEGPDSSVTVNIDGGTVGYVYGGGYRGSIGNESYPLDSVTVNITGGTVLGSVFGGGRGGVDKPIHDTAEGLVVSSDQSGLSDSTGLSYVYADTVTVNVSGGHIKGHIFGGGESVPKLASSLSDGRGYTAGPGSGVSDVAKVVADSINLRVTGGKFDGHIFGAGKGITVSGGKVVDGDGVVRLPSVISISYDDTKKEWGIHHIQWYGGSDDSLSYDTSYDYSGFASVDAGEVNIVFDGFRTGDDPDAESGRYGSIYGGGMMGTSHVDGQVMVNVTNSSIADGIYGGGMGVEGDSDVGSMVAESVYINVYGDAIVGNRGNSYAVFGGGQNAHMTATGGVLIVLNGTGVEVTGDVHGGGLGTQNSGCIVEADRSIVLNGATVFGNIYGGSRFGEDSTKDTFHNSYVALVSGAVTQSVYGGGFQGKSYLNSQIMAGTVAAEFAANYFGLQPVTRDGTDLWVGSIYGGGNLNGGTNDPYTEPLLMGSADIEISFGRSDRFPSYAIRDDELRIDGDIFGQGNYSLIGGTSSVYIHDYDIPEGSSTMSIQYSDIVLLEDCRIDLAGSSDGGRQGLSERFSLIHIGSLHLDRAQLHLRSATSGIGEYVSTIDGSLSAREDCDRALNTDSDGEYHGNEIVLHGGRMFTLVDDYEDGGTQHVTAGVVHGFTLLSNPAGDSYYGLFAMGSDETDDNSGFMVLDGKEEANSIDNDALGIRTWYIAGHVTLGETVTYSTKGESHELSFILPRLYPDSTTVYTYVGNYTDPVVQDGMYVVDPVSYAEYQKVQQQDERTYLGVGIDTDESTFTVQSHNLNGTGDAGRPYEWIRYTQGSHRPITGSNQLTLETSLLSSIVYSNGYGSAGNMGTVVVHLTESIYNPISGYVPVNMIDIVLTVNVRPILESPVDIIVTVMVTPGASGRYSGRGYINLPGEANTSLTYTLTTVTGMETGESIVMWSDTTHLGLSGWTVIRYTEDTPLTVSDDMEQGDVYLGEGGLRDTTIAFDYEGSLTTKSMVIVDENGVIYNITIKPQKAEDVVLDIVYTDIRTDLGDSEQTLYTHYLAVGDGQDGSRESPYSFRWVSEGEGHGITVRYATILSTDTVYYYDTNNEVRTGTLQQAIEEALNITVFITSGDTEEPFNYKDNLDGWYVDANHLAMYDTGSELKEDRTLYASFGVTVTFHGQGVTVSPQIVTLAPGQSLGMFYYNLFEGPGSDPSTDKKITIWDPSTGDVRAGHHLQTFEVNGRQVLSWAIPADDWTAEDPTWTYYSFDNLVFSDTDVYLPWVPNEYDVELVVNGTSKAPDGFTLTVGSGTTTNISDWTQSGSGYSASFKLRYGYTVDIGVGSLVVETALVTWSTKGSDGTSSEQSLIPDGINTHDIRFVVPDAGDQGQKITITITVVEGHSLHVEYVDEGGSVLDVGDSIEVKLYGQGLGTTPEHDPQTLTHIDRNATFLIKGTYGSPYLGLKYMVGGETHDESMYFMVWTSTDGVSYQQVDVGTRGKTADGFSFSHEEHDPDHPDFYIRVAVSKMVTLVELDGSVKELTQHDTRVYVDGYAGYLNVGDMLFTGEKVVLESATIGTYLPPTYFDGVFQEDDSHYTVLGTVDVRFGPLHVSAVDLKVTLVLVDGNGDVIGRSGTIGLLTVTVNGSVRTFQDVEWEGAPKETTIEGIPVSSNYLLTGSAAGFLQASVNISPDTVASGASVELRMTMIEYGIQYLASDGSALVPDYGSLTVWDVFSTGTAPYCLVGGESPTAEGSVETYSGQIWLRGTDDGSRPMGQAVTAMDVGMFASPQYPLYLFAVDIPTGGLGNFDVVERTLYVVESDFGTTLTSINLFNTDLDFHVGNDSGSTIHYDNHRRELTLPKELRGTGTLELSTVSGTTLFNLTIVALPEGEGDVTLVQSSG